MSELYREYRYRRMFPSITDYWEDQALKTDWFLQFERIDNEVKAEQDAQRMRHLSGR